MTPLYKYKPKASPTFHTLEICWRPRASALRPHPRQIWQRPAPDSRARPFRARGKAAPAHLPAVYSPAVKGSLQTVLKPGCVFISTQNLLLQWGYATHTPWTPSALPHRSARYVNRCYSHSSLSLLHGSHKMASSTDLWLPHKMASSPGLLLPHGMAFSLGFLLLHRDTCCLTGYDVPQALLHKHRNGMASQQQRRVKDTLWPSAAPPWVASLAGVRWVVADPSPCRQPVRTRGAQRPAIKPPCIQGGPQRARHQLGSPVRRLPAPCLRPRGPSPRCWPGRRGDMGTPARPCHRHPIGTQPQPNQLTGSPRPPPGTEKWKNE